MRTQSLFSAALLVACFAVLPWAQAADDVKPKSTKSAGSSLDDELLKGLDNELLDDVGGLKPNKPKPSADKPAKPGEPKLDPVPGEDIGQPGEDEDPLIRIGRNMRAAGALIEERQSAAKTIEKQQQIVADLAKLIEEIEKQQQQKKSSSSQSQNQQQTAQRDQVNQPQTGPSKPSQGDSNKPAKDSSDKLRNDANQRATLEQHKGMMKDLWGQLPAKDREQMLQTSPEQFLPKYELLIEKYYKRLAEEQKKQ
jgi:hypothetical protein